MAKLGVGRFGRVRRFLTPRRATAAAVILLLSLLLTASSYLGYLSSLPAPFIDEMADRELIQRLLVVAPHSDDEAIAAGGLIQDVIGRGGEVRVAIVTNGDGSLTGTMVGFRKLYPSAQDYVRSGIDRQRESLNAMAVLGVPEDHVLFLGYPDRGIAALWRDYWYDDNPYRSPFTKLTRSPYDEAYNPGTIYSGSSLLTDLRRIMAEFDPDTVVAPHPADSHVDHWATGAFVALTVSMLPEEVQPRLLLYLVHRGDFPTPRGLLPFAPLLPPLRLVEPLSYWQKVTLTDEMVAAKGEAMEQYRSQLSLLGGFLRSFVRQNELFCEMLPVAAVRLAGDHEVTPVPSRWQPLDGVEVLPVAYDSAGDTMPQEIGTGADFLALYVAQTDTEVWVSAEARGGPARLIAYSAFVRSANGQEVSRARILYPAKVGARPKSQVDDRFMLARFTLAELGYPHTIIVTFEAHYVGGGVIDRAGWATVSLSYDPVPAVAGE